MRKHLGKRERAARKQRNRSTVTSLKPGMSGWLTFKLGHKKFAEWMKYSWEKFRGCVVDAER